MDLQTLGKMKLTNQTKPNR